MVESVLTIQFLSLSRFPSTKYPEGDRENPGQSLGSERIFDLVKRRQIIKTSDSVSTIIIVVDCYYSIIYYY